MNGERFPSKNAKESSGFDAESREKVQVFAKNCFNEIRESVDASELTDDVKVRIEEFFSDLENEIKNDNTVEKRWVSFTEADEIVRARSEDGVYDADGTTRYILTEFQTEFMGIGRWDGIHAEDTKKEISELYDVMTEVFQKKLKQL